MAFTIEPFRFFLASSSALAFPTYSLFEMTALVQPNPSLPLEPPDPPDQPEPPDPPDLSSAPLPSHSASRTHHHHLLTPTISPSLDLNGTRFRISNCSRRLLLPSPGCFSLRPQSRDSVSHLHSRRLMCPSPSPSPRSHVEFSGPANHSLIGQDLCSSKGFDLAPIPISRHPSR